MEFIGKERWRRFTPPSCVLDVLSWPDMGESEREPGWYPDPDGYGARYFDGEEWTDDWVTPTPVPARQVIKGPKHWLHFLLTVLTFWALGGWLWIWLLVALSGRKYVLTVDIYGNVIRRQTIMDDAALRLPWWGWWIAGCAVALAGGLVITTALRMAAH
jgi:hypothetical protein